MNKLKGNLIFKIGAFVIIFVLLVIAGIYAFECKKEYPPNLFSEDIDTYCQIEYLNVAAKYAEGVIGEVKTVERNAIEDKSTNILYIRILDENEKYVYFWVDREIDEYRAEDVWQYEIEVYGISGERYKALIKVDSRLLMKDRFSMAREEVQKLYDSRYSFLKPALFAGVALIAAFFCYCILIAATGWKSGEEKPVAGWNTKIPFEIWSVILFGIPYLAIRTSYVLFLRRIDFMNEIAVVVILALLGCLFTYWCMNIAVRIKTVGFWKSTLIFLILNLIWKLFKLIGKGIATFFSLLPALVKGVAIILSTVILLGPVSWILFSFAGSRIGYRRYVAGALLFFVIICVILVLNYFLILMYRLYSGAKQIINGDLDYKIVTKGMIWEFKKHGENLNNISEAMNIALEDRVKSEKMKTELITNVSHDIKTPITSVINYSELIYKNAEDADKVKEYTEVLIRQSERLKRLVEDIVEVSKVRTGNLEVELTKCDAKNFVTQSIGEYEDKIQSAGLTLVTRVCDGELSIMADGRRMLRIFDNLISNICKYALSGSRVYLILEEIDQKAVFTFKNTSREALDISPDELMERFVRGEASRHTEGSGLGLSIAKDLAVLQGGDLRLEIDGDLFKAILSFPIIMSLEQ